MFLFFFCLLNQTYLDLPTRLTYWHFLLCASHFNRLTLPPYSPSDRLNQPTFLTLFQDLSVSIFPSLSPSDFRSIGSSPAQIHRSCPFVPIESIRCLFPLSVKILQFGRLSRVDGHLFTTLLRLYVLDNPLALIRIPIFFIEILKSVLFLCDFGADCSPQFSVR